MTDTQEPQPTPAEEIKVLSETNAKRAARLTQLGMEITPVGISDLKINAIINVLKQMYPGILETLDLEFNKLFAASLDQAEEVLRQPKSQLVVPTFTPPASF